MAMHDGHRERVRTRFLKEGLDHFSDVQALELLLFYAIPRRDTNPTAHALLEHFGSFSQVMEAPVEQLQKVAGVTAQAAALIHLTLEMSRYYMVDRSSCVKILNTVEQCAQYIYPCFYGRRTETVFLLCLDAKCKVLCCKEIAQGSINSAFVSVRQVVETALSVGASTVVLAHNHPSGIALPSEEDLETTRRVAQALHSVEIVLADHVIVADDDYVSLAVSGGRYRQCLIPNGGENNGF